VLAAWVRSIERATLGSIARWRSKYWLRTWHPIPICASGSSARPAPVSALNHPHICGLYDIGDASVAPGESVRFLVLEYLEGETLADRLRKSAMPFDQVLRVATDVADALEKAHRAGMVHREAEIEEHSARFRQHDVDGLRSR